MTGERWWLFYTGYPGSSGGKRSVLVAAVSQTGASWDRVGAILEPEQGEVAVSHPCVLEVSRTIYLFYALIAVLPEGKLPVDSSVSVATPRRKASPA